jgi:hypothetical protein
MKNYVFVYYNAANATDTPAAEAWGQWFGQLGDKIVDAGNPFNGNGQAVEKSGVTSIENYPATGYTIVKAATMDDAVKLAQDCPLLVSSGAAVRVYEALPM